MFDGIVRGGLVFLCPRVAFSKIAFTSLAHTPQTLWRWKMFDGVCLGVLSVVLMVLAGGVMWFYIRKVVGYYHRQQEKKSWGVQQRLDRIFEKELYWGKPRWRR